MLNRLKNNWLWIVLLFSLFIVIYLIIKISGGEILQLDQFFHYLIVENLRSDFLTPVMKFITMLGSSYVIIGIAVLSFIVLFNKRWSILISLNLIFAFLLSQGLKFVIQRERPFGYHLIIEKGFSFPSGHSMVSTAFYGFIIYLIYRNCQSGMKKYISITLLSILIVLIGISRVYLGVHYMSDVIAGFFISISYLILYIKVINQYIDGGKENEK